MPTLPPYLKVNFDFNATLMDAGFAARYCREIEKYTNIALFESPMPQEDVEGNVKLRRQTSVAIAMHYGSPPPMTALKEDVCDGFVIGPTHQPGCFEDFVKFVIPELQRRGIYRKEYSGTTLRDHLGLKRPAIGRLLGAAGKSA